MGQNTGILTPEERARITELQDLLIERFWFAHDSALEEAVSSEPVSEAKFPASWENTGNFVRRGLRVRLLARNPASNSMVCEPIPYASEQGIYFGLAGN
jgi:hypothetical protein